MHLNHIASVFTAPIFTSALLILVKKVDTSTCLFSSTAAVNADKAPVNEDLSNSKSEESAIRRDSKKKNSKEKPNIETNVNLNPNNNAERQRRETEKKTEMKFILFF